MGPRSRGGPGHPPPVVGKRGKGRVRRRMMRGTMGKLIDQKRGVSEDGCNAKESKERQ